MKKLIVLFFISITTLSTAQAYEVAKLKYALDFLIDKTLEKKHQTKRADVPLPTFHFQSTTPLKQFQDAIEKQWGFRPDVFTNAFALENNEIYIMDEAEYYRKSERCMDDSVVHELTHYVQVKYLNWDLNDESLEWDAIEVQTQFREEFCRK
jgi:hypothetical protein